MSEEAFDLVKGSLARRKQSATTVMLAEPTPQEIEALFSERITPETELPPMQPLFRMNEENCFYRGELVADCGKAKSGKTFFLSILMAGALKRQLFALERLCEEPLKVLWIDTEQSQQSTQEILKDRIMPLADLESLDDTRFYAFNLRGLGFDRRQKMVDVAIRVLQPDIVILDGIEDPANLGAILRSCDAFGVDGVIIKNTGGVSLNSTVAKVSTGAVMYVPVCGVANLSQAISELKDSRYWIIASDGSATKDYDEVDYKGPVALVVGSEGFGISRLVLQNSDLVVKIPMVGHVNSLNASVATGILLSQVALSRK